MPSCGPWERVALLAWVCFPLLAGCASWSFRVTPPPSARTAGLTYLPEAPPIAQRAYQCGPAALASVLRSWGDAIPVEEISREVARPGARGVLNVSLARYARERGFWTEIRTGHGPEELAEWLRRGIPPILMVRVGPRMLASYHFIVLTGFDHSAGRWYANVGMAEPHAIPDPQLRRRWREAGRWMLIVCPPGRVDWPLTGEQAEALAPLLERAGDFEAAARRYQQALADRPADAALRFNLANVYLRMQRWADAKAIYEELLRDQPFARHLTNNLAWAHLHEGRPDQAIALIEEAFRHGAEPGYDILDTLGLAYCRARQPEVGQGYLRRALELVPSIEQEAQQAIRGHLEACGEER